MRAATRRRRLEPPAAVARWALPLAAVLVAGLWVRGHVPFVAWDLARDHDKCFSMSPAAREGLERRAAGRGRLVRGAGHPAAGPAGPGRRAGARRRAVLPARRRSRCAPHVYYASAGQPRVGVRRAARRAPRRDRFAGAARGDASACCGSRARWSASSPRSEADVRAVERPLRPVPRGAWGEPLHALRDPRERRGGDRGGARAAGARRGGAHHPRLGRARPLLLAPGAHVRLRRPDEPAGHRALRPGPLRADAVRARQPACRLARRGRPRARLRGRFASRVRPAPPRRGLEGPAGAVARSRGAGACTTS